jgi:5-(carboxyamino)imidazole ribonucleotide mutase
MVNAKQVLIVMGSASDDETMSQAADILKEFEIGYEYRVASAHRSPDVVAALAKGAQAEGYKVIIAGAGGAAHLPGVIAAYTCLPVIGVPIQSAALNGMDSLLSIVQMPGGIPVASMAIGKAGAKNAALFAVQIIALGDANIATRMEQFRKEQSAKALKQPLASR